MELLNHPLMSQGNIFPPIFLRAKPDDTHRVILSSNKYDETWMLDIMLHGINRFEGCILQRTICIKHSASKIS